MASKSIGLLNIVFGADLKGFERAMRKAQRSVKKFGKSMQRTGANMTRNITMPIIALGAVAIKTFADFEQSMLKVKAVSGATAGEFKTLTDNAKKLGSTTMFTASQVAELQFQLAKLGFKPKEIKDATGNILALAQATSTDLAESGRIAAVALNSFNAEASESGKFADIMALASSSAAMDMEKFGAALPIVGSTARLAGDDFEGLSAKLMVLADAGIEGSKMGTHLKIIYNRLASEGLTWDQGMQALINSNFDLVTAQELFGRNASNTALLLAENVDKTKQYSKANKEATGTAQNMAEIMDSGVGGAMRRLKSQAEGVAIQLGEMLVPVFTKLLNKIKDLLGWWSGLDKETKNIIVTIGILAAALGPVVSVIGTMAVAFAGLLSPIGLVVAAILAIVVAFAYVRENWEAFKERLGDWNWLLNALITAVQWVIDYNPFAIILKSINSLLKYMGVVQIPDVWTAISDGLEDLKVETKEYENEFGSFKDAMINQAKELDDVLGVTTFFKGAGKSMGVGGGTGGGEDDESPLIGDTEQAFETYQEYLDSLTEPTEETLTTLQQFWVDFFANISDGLKKMGEGLGETLSQGAANFYLFGEQVKNAIHGVIRGLIGQGVAAAVANALKSTAIVPWMIPVVAGAAAGLAKTAFSSLIPKFAQGGLVSGSTLGLIGEGSGTSAFNPEVVSPLDKLQGMLGGGNVNVHGRIQGNNIVLVSDKATISRERFI